MFTNDEEMALGVAILPDFQEEYYSGIDAPVLSWISQNVSKDVSEPTNEHPFKDYYSADGDPKAATTPKEPTLTDAQKQQVADTAMRGATAILGKLSSSQQSVYAQGLKATCGKKPLIGKKKRDAFFKCQAKFNTDFVKKEKMSPDTTTPRADNSKKTKEWYENPVVIVGAVAGLSLLAFLGYKVATKPKAIQLPIAK